MDDQDGISTSTSHSSLTEGTLVRDTAWRANISTQSESWSFNPARGSAKRAHSEDMEKASQTPSPTIAVELDQSSDGDTIKATEWIDVSFSPEQVPQHAADCNGMHYERNDNVPSSQLDSSKEYLDVYGRECPANRLKSMILPVSLSEAIDSGLRSNGCDQRFGGKEVIIKNLARHANPDEPDLDTNIFQDPYKAAATSLEGNVPQDDGQSTRDISRSVGVDGAPAERRDGKSPQHRPRIRVTPAPDVAVKMTSMGSNRPLNNQFLAPIQYQRRHPPYNSSPEGATELDITDAEVVRAVSSSPPVQAMRTPAQDGNSPVSPQNCSNDLAPLLDDTVLEQLIENSIKRTKSLLFSGSNKRALATSQEIARLMRNFLRADVQTGEECNKKSSLSDLLDRSAWRG